jgi:predicted amidohydrolase
MIELRRGRYFNSAVVIRSGQVVGVYRKTHLSAGESLFEPGGAFPVFELNGVTYGINICFDTNFADAAAPLAAQGAQLMLVPSQNMMKRDAGEDWKLLHNRIRAERVRETGMWLVSADVTGARDDLRVAYGPTSVMNPQAEIVAQVPLMATGMVLAEIE